MENLSFNEITMARTVLLIGPPGSGKGTQGRALGILPGCTFVSMGEVLRSSDPDSEIRRCQRGGDLVPIDLVITAWKRHVHHLIATGFQPGHELLLLDGLPRNIEQAERLQAHLRIAHVLHLACEDDSVLAGRIRKRSGDREDDTDESVTAHRFEIYHQQTEPLIDWYRDETVASIDATRPPLEILHQIAGLLKGGPIPEANKPTTAIS